jgi:hypothetical protein
MEQFRDQRPTNDILAELSREVRVWLQQEMKLAKAEVSLHVARIRKGSVLIAVGAVLAVLGCLALFAAAIIALAIVLPWWLSALLIGLAFVILGGVLAMAGIKKIKSADLVPHETISKVKEDVQWLKTQVT